MARKKEKFSPAELIKEFQHSGLDPSLFEEVDERHLQQAPNFIEWVTHPKFLNTSILPSQVMIGTKLFAEHCPRCSKPGYLDDLLGESLGEIKQNVAFLEFGKCPKCGVTRYELFQEQEINDYNEFVGILGQRSGKSKGVGLLSTYVLHRLLCIPNPLRYFNQPAGEMLVGTFSAMTADQAERNLWQSFMGFIDASPWFQNYHKFLKDEEKRLKTELLVKRKSFILYNHKNVTFHYTGSQDRKMRGATRIWGTIDELGWFTSDESKSDAQIMNADAVYTALVNSLATMRMKHKKIFGENNYNVPPIIMANISSPSSVKDKIMRLLKDSKNTSRMLALQKPTWACNPDFTKKDLRDEYSHYDDVTFMRDFGAEPPLESSPFLDDSQVIDKVAVLEQRKRFWVEVIRDKDSMGDQFLSGKLHIERKDPVTPRMITFDLGHSKNGLGMSMFSVGPDGKARLDYIFGLYPERGRNINLAHFFDNVTLPLVQNFNIAHVFFDRWQSLDQIARLRDMKVDASSYSLKYREMEDCKGMLKNKGILIPKIDEHEKVNHFVSLWVDNDLDPYENPVAQLAIQLLTVRDLGYKMLKPLEGDDDLFRSFCLGINRLSDPKVRKVYKDGANVGAGGQSVAPLGVVRSKVRGGPGLGSGRQTIQGENGVIGSVGSQRKRS